MAFLPWEDIESNERFKSLPHDQQLKVKTGWFDDNIATSPSYQNLPDPDKEKVRGKFFPKEGRTVGEFAKDTGIGLATGVVNLGRAAVGVADIATGNIAGKGLEAIGYDPEATVQTLESGYSEPYKQARQEVHQTEGFWNTVGALIDNPSVAFGTVVESAVLSLGGMAAARAAATMMLGSALASNGIKAGSEAAQAFARKFFSDPKITSKIIAAGAGAEGATSAGLMQETQREAEKGYAESLPYSLGAGATTAGIGILSSKIPGFRDAEAMLATAGQAGRKAGVLKAGKEIAKTMFKEGVLEELPQEVTEQIWENLALGQPWDEGLGQAGALGMVAGMGQGGGMSLASTILNPSKDIPVDDLDLSKVIPLEPDAVELDPDSLTPGEAARAQAEHLFDQQAPSLLTDSVEARAEEDYQASSPELAEIDLRIQNLEVTSRISPKAKENLETLKAERQQILAENTKGRPSTAREAAEALSQDVTPRQAQVELEAEEREESTRRQTEQDLLTDMAESQEEAARGVREKDLRKSFGDRDFHIPEKIRPAIVKMEAEMKQREAPGLRTQGEGNDQEVIGRYPAVSPDWFRQDTLKEYDKKHGTKYADFVNAVTINATLRKIRAGQELTGRQGEVWQYLQEVAREQMQTDPELVQGREVDEMQAKGFDPTFETMPAAALEKGDKIIGRVEGQLDEFEHKGTDPDGNIILEDGIIAKVDPFDLLEVEGIKKQDEVPFRTPEDQRADTETLKRLQDKPDPDTLPERRRLDASGNRIDRRQTPPTPGIEIKAERNRGLLRLWDRIAARNRVAERLSADEAEMVLGDLHDELLGDYGVTTFADVRRVAAQLDKQGVPYVIERSDGGNMGGVNKAHKGDHHAADQDIRKVWGEVYVTRVREHGCVVGRAQGDELLTIWPNYTVAEVEKIRAAIEQENRARRDELGYKDTLHEKVGLPTGALHINYGLVQGEPGEHAELERKADRLQDSQKQAEQLAIAEAQGYTFNQEIGKYERRSLQQETRPTGERDAAPADRVPGELGGPGSTGERTGVVAPPERAEPAPREVANSDIEKAASEAATSPDNNLPEPTDAQKEAGVYKMGHVRLHGLGISIENPKGSTRSGTDQSGKRWSVTMRHHYGYIKETKGKDKDHLDVFIGEHPETSRVFVVDQVDPRTGKFDEHKVLMGFISEQKAIEGYLANYEKGWRGLGAITSMSPDDFKAWAKGDTTKPLGLKKEPVAASEAPSRETQPGLSLTGETQPPTELEIKRQAKDLVDSASVEEIQEKIQAIFGTTHAEMDALDEQAALEREPVDNKIVDLADDFMADIEYAARTRNRAEVESLLTELYQEALGHDLSEGTRGDRDRSPAQDRDVQPATTVPERSKEEIALWAYRDEAMAIGDRKSVAAVDEQLAEFGRHPAEAAPIATPEAKPAPQVASSAATNTPPGLSAEVDKSSDKPKATEPAKAQSSLIRQATARLAEDARHVRTAKVSQPEDARLALKRAWESALIDLADPAQDKELDAALLAGMPIEEVGWLAQQTEGVDKLQAAMDKARKLGEENPDGSVTELSSQAMKDGSFAGRDQDRIIEVVHEGQYQAIQKKAQALPVPILESDLRGAEQAYSATSHTPDKRARAFVRDYVRSMVSAWERAEPKAKTEADRQRLVDEFRSFKHGYVTRLNAYLSAHSRVMSAMIVGPAKFPTRSNEKKGRTADKRLEEASEWFRKGQKRVERAALGPIDRSPASELEQAQKKLADSEKLQSLMKEANKVIRKKGLSEDERIAGLQKIGLSEKHAHQLLKPDFAGRIGFADYQLTNNNAEIRRLRQRVSELEGKAEKAASDEAVREVPFDGGTIELNYPDNFLRIRHDAKPDAEVRQALKGKGFRWSPHDGAWRRKLTDNAIYDAEKITGATIEAKEADGELPLFSRKERSGAPLETPVEPVSIRLRENVSVPLAQIFYNSQLQNKPAVNLHTGWEISFPAKGRGKVLSHGRGNQAHLSSIYHLREIVEKAVMYDTGIDADGRPIHTFFGNLIIGERNQYRGKLIVREDAAGRKFYDLSESKIERPDTSGRGAATGADESSAAPDLSPITLGELVSLVNEEFSLYSRGEGEAKPAKAAPVEKEISARIGQSRWDRLVASGKVKVVEFQADLPVRTTGTVQGMFYGKSVYLVAENIEVGESYGVLLHELGEHARLPGLLGERYANLMRQVDELAETVPALMEARRTAIANNPRGSKARIARETLAYFCQDTANERLPFFKRILAAVRAWAYRWGLNIDLTADDMRALVLAAVKRDTPQLHIDERLTGAEASREVKLSSVGRGLFVNQPPSFKGIKENQQNKPADPRILFSKERKKPPVVHDQRAPIAQGERNQQRPFYQEDTAQDDLVKGSPEPLFSKKDTPEALSLENLADTAKTMGSITIRRPSKVDSTFLDRVLSTPEYYFKKAGAAARVLQAALLRRDVRYQKEQEILAGFEKFVKDLRKRNAAAYAEASDYIIHADQTGKGYGVREIDGLWKVLDPKGKPVAEFESETEAVAAMIESEAEALAAEGYHPDVVEAVRLARGLTNRGFDVMAADMRRIIEESAKTGEPNPYVGDGAIDESGRYGVYAAGKKKPIALFGTLEEANAALEKAAEMMSYIVIGSNKGDKEFGHIARAKAWVAKHGGEINGRKTFGNLTVRKRTDSEMRPLTVKQALAEMGDLRGTYFPRIREPGEYVLTARKDGANPIRKQYDLPGFDGKLSLLNTATPIGREARRLKNQGYHVEIKRSESPVDDVFAATNLLTSLDAILQESMAVIDKNNSADVLAGQHINKLLTLQIADIFKARGYLSSRLKRLSGDDTWEGYETDLSKALIQYGKGVAAGTAKRDTARAMMTAFAGRDYTWDDYKQEVDSPSWDDYMQIVQERRIDPAKQKNLFVDVRSFIVDVLRNDEQSDRIIGVMKGLAVLKFLGFRVSSAAVNATNMVTGVPGTLAGRTGISLPEAMRYVTMAASAYGQYRTGRGSEADRAIFRHISEQGWDEAQFNHEAAGELRSKLGNTWDKVMVGAMYMFGAVEKANRATTIFAAYKAEKSKNPEASESVIWERAKEISDRAHGVYGKETLPAWARGKFNPLRLTYTFQKFSHNYMLNMLDLGFNKKEYAAASFLLLSPAVLAGAGATIATPILMALAQGLGLGGDDPEEELYRWAEETMGTDAFARHGLVGLAGVNMRGSLQINTPFPARLGEIFGAPGSIVTDTIKSLQHFGKGETGKGIEALLPTAFGSMSKATREHREGVTTGNYGTVFYGNEPLKADTFDAAVRFLSFNPSKISGIREKQWRERQVAERYREEKREIYSLIKRLHVQGKPWVTPEVLKEIAHYNERARAAGRVDITPITPDGVRRMLIAANRPSKLERARQTAM